MRYAFIVGLVVLAVAAAYSSVFTVDRTEFVYLTQFGQPIETFDGETEAGLHWKLPWPIQSVQRIDRRLQVFDLPETELLTHDRQGQTIDKTLTIGAYVTWRIPDKQGVDQFIRSVGRPERAQDILGQRMSSRLGAELGKMAVDNLISVAPTEEVERRMDRLRDQLLNGGDQESLAKLARDAYGIGIVDIRLRRFNHPASVRGEIFNRITSERKKKAMEYQSKGMKEASDITSEAQRVAKDIDTEARAQAELLRREADIRGDDIRNQAQAKDRDFYAFLQKLKTYQSILGESRDVLLLSSKHDLFDMLLKPPRPNPPSEPGPMTKTGGQ